MHLPILVVLASLTVGPQQAVVPPGPTVAPVADTLAPFTREQAARRRADSLYIAVLERTNAQLNMGWTPYGVAFGVLSTILAVGAIGAAVLLYRQSAEYKEVIRKASEATTTSLVRDYLANAEKANKAEQAAMEQRVAQATDEKTRAQLQQQADELKRLGEALRYLERTRPMIIDATGQSVTHWSSYAASLGNPTFHPAPLSLRFVCDACRRPFTIPAPEASTLGAEAVYCPFCGHPQGAPPPAPNA